MQVGGIPSVSSIGGRVELLRSVKIGIAYGKGNSCAFRTSRIGVTFIEDRRFLGHYAGLHNDIVLVNPVVTHFKRTVVTGPKNSGVKHHELSARFLNVRGLKTGFSCSIRHKMCSVRTRRLYKTGVLLSRTSIANATGVVVTTMLTGKAAAVCGTTYRPCVRRLYHLLGTVKTEVANVTSGLLAVIKISSLRNTMRAVLPSVVRINDFVNVTTVMNSKIHVGGINCSGLNVVPCAFDHLKVRIVHSNSSLFVPPRRRCRVRSFLSNSFVALDSTP